MAIRQISKRTTMKGFDLDGTPPTSRSTWLDVRPRLTGLLLIVASLLVAVAAGCSDGPVPTDSPHQNDTPLTDDGQVLTIALPQHSAPLGTDRGGEYIAGQMVLDEGCLRLEVPDKQEERLFSFLLIWPSSFSLEEESGTVRVVDGLGRTAARAGDHIRVSRAAVPYQQGKDLASQLALSVDCPKASFVIVGDEVTVFDPENEATELRLSDPDVLFLRQETVVSLRRVFLAAAGVGELVLDDQCLRFKGGATILWPAGFTPHVEDGVVVVRNGAGRTIARVGDEIAGGGGGFKSEHEECPGGVFRIHEIKVLPDVQVYFPQWDEAIKMGQVIKPRTGELALDGKCLVLRKILDGDVPQNALLLWPETYSLNVEDGAVEVLDATGRVVARVGDEVQVNAFDVTYGQATKHGGLEEITPGCWAPYWAVEEIVASTAGTRAPNHKQQYDLKAGRVVQELEP